MVNEDARRDPVEVIRHARAYLQKTRGEKLFEHSLAGRILAEAERRSAKCIDYLLNDKMRTAGVHCPCEFHETEHQLTQRYARQKPRNGKKAAAGDRPE